MKELNKKVFLILFGMLTVILIVSLVIVNIIGYRREYESISRNLRVISRMVTRSLRKVISLKKPQKKLRKNRRRLRI